MRKGILFLALFAFIACSNSSSEVIDEKEQLKPEQPVDGTLTADGNSAKTYDLIKRSGYNHEAPDSSREHKTEHFQHIQQVHDNQLNKYVFAFFIHAEIDDDRGLTNITDRQRNEIKTDNKSPKSLVGQKGETMVFRWKFCLPSEKTQIQKVGFCTGGAQDFINKAAEKDCDAYISGEVSERTFYEAKELGVHYFACGHHATERYGVQRLAQAITNQFAVETIYFELNNPI
jgi:hypothetical protein